MANTVPQKALVAIPDFQNPTSDFKVVSPDEALVPAFDRSFHFGDSIYEVIRTYDGILFSADEHMRRLRRSLELAEFALMPDFSQIEAMVHRTSKAWINKYGKQDLYIRIIVSRGMSDLNIDTRGASNPYSLVFVKPISPVPSEYYEKGVHLSVVERRRNHPSALDPAMKSGNYLNNILALNEAIRLGGSDAILLSQQGFVTEATTSNIFAVKNGVVWTAPLSVGILAGITRDFIFETCKEAGIPYEERLFTRSELFACDEVFLSSSLKEVLPITKLNNIPVGGGLPGPVTRDLHLVFKKRLYDYLTQRSSESLFL